jgi:hypothetical protein
MPRNAVRQSCCSAFIHELIRGTVMEVVAVVVEFQAQLPEELFDRNPQEPCRRMLPAYKLYLSHMSIAISRFAISV